MNKIDNTLLANTLNLMQITRETAKLKGSQTQADRIGPIVEQLDTLVKAEQKNKLTPSDTPSGVMAQSDFAALLQTVKTEQAKPSATTSLNDRNRMIQSMSGGGMNELEIARYMGITRDEVKVVLNLSRQDSFGGVK